MHQRQFPDSAQPISPPFPWIASRAEAAATGGGGGQEPLSHPQAGAFYVRRGAPPAGPPAQLTSEHSDAAARTASHTPQAGGAFACGATAFRQSCRPSSLCVPRVVPPAGPLAYLPSDFLTTLSGCVPLLVPSSPPVPDKTHLPSVGRSDSIGSTGIGPPADVRRCSVAGFPLVGTPSSAMGCTPLLPIPTGRRLPFPAGAAPLI